MSTTTTDQADARKPRRTSEEILEEKAVVWATKRIASGDGDGVKQMLEAFFTVTDETRHIRL